MVNSFPKSRGLLCAALLLTVGAVRADSCSTSGSCPTVKCFQRRSDSRHSDRLMTGQVHHMDKYESESWYGLLSITPGYSKTFKSDEIAKCLFGSAVDCDGCPTVYVQGTAVENRRANAWLADNFYLPRNYDGKFTVDPTIGTFHLDIDFYLGLDECLQGLYARVWGTVVHTKWDLNFHDSPGFTDGTPRDHDAGYFSPRVFPGADLVQSFANYASGGTPTLSDGTGTVVETNNIMKFNGLKYAKLSCDDRTETGFADLRVELGWNFLRCEDYHLGLNVQFAAPTGEKKQPCYLFDAHVGNGDHWELGGGLSGHYMFWSSEDGDSSLSFHLNAAVTHLFDKTKRRTFDLCNKPNSAYMLASKFGANPEGTVTVTNANFTPAGTSPVKVGGTTATGSVAVDPTMLTPDPAATAPNRQFALEYAPVANLSTVSVDVSVSVQADVVAMFNYRCGNWHVDLGYNFWARGCEDIDCVKSCKDGSICDSAQANTWALKGDARMFGYQGPTQDSGTGGAVLPANFTAVPLSATQSGAVICSGTNKVAVANIAPSATAPGNDVNLVVDAPGFAYVVSPLDGNNQVGPLSYEPLAIRFDATNVDDWLDLDAQNVHVKTSTTPVFLKCADLDLTRLRGLSHTVFGYLGYYCENGGGQAGCWSWNPYFGLGWSAEFGTHDDCCDTSSGCGSASTSSTSSACSTACKTCIDCAPSEWSVWVKGGITFG